MKISAEKLSSFVGDVRPIWIEDGTDLKWNKRIAWKLSGDAVTMEKFGGYDHGCFYYGVLVTFVKEGAATVTATYEGVEYKCEITSRARRDFSGMENNFYKGDTHAHSQEEHDHDTVCFNRESSPAEYIEAIDKEALREFAPITDHASTIDDEFFFRGFMETERRMGKTYPIIFPGSESEIAYTEYDRYNNIHRLSGELVTLNAKRCCYSKTYEEFFYTMGENPYAIGVFAHPHVIGGSTRGVWNYRPRTNPYNDKLKKLIKYVEVLGAPSGRENTLHEYVYSEALDAGYRVSSTCGSDQHNNWDFNAYPGAVVIMAPEKSREAFLDALLNLRAYATESGNIKLRYFVNGKEAPCDLEEATKYHFEVKIDYFYEDKMTRPVRLEVISDGGKTIKTIENGNFENIEFDIESDTARWFYIRLVDSYTYRTFSVPVFTGREITPHIIDDLKPIDKSKFKITDEKGRDASVLINDDISTEWQADGTSATLTIDIGEEKTVRGLGNYSVGLLRPYSGDIRRLMAEQEAVFPVDYRIYSSLDGVNFDLWDEGVFRTFSGEEILKFEPRTTKFVKIELLSTTGTRLGRSPYNEIPMKISEFTLFE